jgi:hypothetical protein
VRHAEGRAFIARQAPASWDAIVIDAFVAATVPSRLITMQALGEAARAAPLALVNVLDDRAAREVHAVGAACAHAYASVWALGGRAGNTIVVGTSGELHLDLDRIAAQLAADPSPARITSPDAMARAVAGTVPLRDEGVERARP